MKENNRSIFMDFMIFLFSEQTLNSLSSIRAIGLNSICLQVNKDKILNDLI